jgi:hypothetical protein
MHASNFKMSTLKRLLLGKIDQERLYALEKQAMESTSDDLKLHDEKRAFELEMTIILFAHQWLKTTAFYLTGAIILYALGMKIDLLLFMVPLYVLFGFVKIMEWVKEIKTLNHKRATLPSQS